MARTSKQYILDRFVDEQLCYFKIYEGTSGTSPYSIAALLDGNPNHQEALSLLTEALDAVSGFVTVVISKLPLTGQSASRKQQYKFTVRLGDEDRSVIAGPMVGQNDAYFKLKYEFDMYKLRQELTERPDPVMTEAIGLLKQVLMTPSAPRQVAGTGTGVLPHGHQYPQSVPHTQAEHTGQNQPSQEALDASQRLTESIRRIGQIDPGIVENIEALADLAENNPDMYMMAISTLKDQQNPQPNE